MDEVKIEILGIKGAKRNVESILDILGSMEGVPKLGGQPELVARDTTGLDGFTDFLFILR